MWKKFKDAAQPRTIAESDGTPAPPKSETFLNRRCSCRAQGRTLLRDMTTDPAEILILALMRCSMAGIATGSVHFWNDAFRMADENIGPGHGPLLAGRVLALARAIRQERTKDYHFQGMGCEGITRDEVDLLFVLRLFRMGEIERAEHHLARFATNPETPATALAFGGLAALLEVLPQFGATETFEAQMRSHRLH